MVVKVIANNSEFQRELLGAGGNLVVVDFTASWCGPCQRIAPHFNTLSDVYVQAVFLKVDIDHCREIAQAHGVTAVPTFIFFRNQVKLETVRGVDQVGLEAKIKLYAGSAAQGDEVEGHMDLSPYYDSHAIECLNESDAHTLKSCLSGDGFLESDCDEQLIISIGFNCPIKLHSFKIKSEPAAKGPKKLKLFINQPKTIDFDQGSSMEAVQDFTLTEAQLNGEDPVLLKFVKFQNVLSLIIFVADNQSGDEVTRINRLTFFGSPLAKTNMNELKRVAGKAGEIH